MHRRTFQAAKTIAELSGWTISNLPLQKLLYLSHLLYLGKTDDPLIDGRFEAWDLGPVEPNLYHKVKAYGDGPVADVFPVDSFPEGTSEYETIADVYRTFGQSSPGKLVQLTHWNLGAWATHYRPGIRGIVIADASILNEYARRREAAHSG